MNGPYMKQGPIWDSDEHWKGILWLKYKGYDYSLKFVEMKIRPYKG